MTFNFRLVNNEFQRFEFVIPSGSPGFGPRFWGCLADWLAGLGFLKAADPLVGAAGALPAGLVHLVLTDPTRADWHIRF